MEEWSLGTGVSSTGAVPVGNAAVDRVGTDDRSDGRGSKSSWEMIELFELATEPLPTQHNQTQWQGEGVEGASGLSSAQQQQQQQK